MSIEKQRTKSITIFVVANLVQDAFILVGNFAVAIQGFCQSVISTVSFVKYDQATKYKTITGGDLGDAIGCPGHFTGECEHRQDVESFRPDDDEV